MDESKLKKIEGLLRKAERTDNAQEAETFYAKAQELMAKWAIDEAMLRSESPGRVNVIQKDIILNKSGIWRSNLVLISQLARPNNVKIIYVEPYGTGSKPIVHLIGFEEDIANVEMLYMSMLVQNQRARRTLMPPEIKANSKRKAPWMRSFIEGFAVRIGERLTEMKRMAEKDAAVTYGESSLLPVLASKEQAVLDEMKKRFPHTGPAKRSRRATDWGGMDAGRRAADSADIGQKGMPGAAGALGA